ncbi:MAG: histidine phosphatase family protein [Acidimicrobiia bacterium]
MPTPDVRLLVLRHGRSEWNAVRRWQGRFDSPLDVVGRAQATAVADELAGLGERWSRPTSSTLGRAAETAAIIAARLGLEPPTLDERLVEAHAGEWQGLTPAEIEAAYPGWLAAHRRPEGFEPLERVVARATAALLDVAHTTPDGSSALVVSHSGLIRSVVRSLGLTDTRIPNLGGVWFRLPTGDRSATGRLRLVVDELFDPHGVVVSGVDAPGEDPGEQSDQREHHGRAER